MVSCRETIKRLIVEQLEEDGQAIPDLSDAVMIVDSGLDSLGFAVLVTQLEDQLGYDPFTLTPDAVYPKTLGEFISFYERFEQSR
ncbi:acyl carrier protein [Pengzhenrongella sicca]|uniref:Acyl carrier protein n=1 Tax=Pengzhenrongella sicca TaxID=2819238 RepID=A0A8A4ZD72_9MICO|nr:acyl carrier protein [Pengzhenrongella sicca]QTE29864.1 acyl carrier protein [Pengzhenrongella sicca]